MRSLPKSSHGVVFTYELLVRLLAISSHGVLIYHRLEAERNDPSKPFVDPGPWTTEFDRDRAEDLLDRLIENQSTTYTLDELYSMGAESSHRIYLKYHADRAKEREEPPPVLDPNPNKHDEERGVDGINMLINIGYLVKITDTRYSIVSF